MINVFSTDHTILITIEIGEQVIDNFFGAFETVSAWASGFGLSVFINVQVNELLQIDMRFFEVELLIFKSIFSD